MFVGEDVSTWFNYVGSNCPLGNPPYYVTTTADVSLASPVTIDPTTFNLKINTNEPYIGTVRVWIQTSMNIKKYQEINIYTCGQEVLGLTLTSVPQYILNLHASNGVTDLQKYTNHFPSMFTNNDTTKCPIVGYKIMYKDPSDNIIKDYPNTNVKANVNDLEITTAAYIKDITFYVQAYTKSGRTKEQELFIIVCGYETVQLVDNVMPYNKYELNSGTGGFQYPLNAKNMFVQIPYCPILDYSLETESGGVYTSWTDPQFSLQADETLKVQTTPGRAYFYIYIKAWTATTGVFNRKKLMFHICGTETVSLSNSHPTTPFYLFALNQGGGNVKQVDVKTYFTIDHPECPINQWDIMTKDISNNYVVYSASPLRVWLTTVGATKMLTVRTVDE